MPRAQSFAMTVQMKDGKPFGESAVAFAKMISAYKQVEEMTKKKYRVRITARGSRAATIANCTRAAVYLYITKVK